MKSIGELLKWGYSQARVQQINFKFYLHVFTSCYKHFFSRCITSCIDICFQVVIYKLLQVGTRCLCVAICLQVVTSCLCVTICLQVVTHCIYKLLQCTSNSCINTFGNDVVLHKALHGSTTKSGLKIILHTTVVLHFWPRL